MQETYKIEKRDWAAKLMAIVVVVTMVTSTFVLFAPEASARTEDNDGGFGYTMKDSAESDGPTYEWTDIASTGEKLLGFTSDGAQGPFDIGFDFEFYETTYNQFYNGGDNGYITFGAGVSSRWTPYSIPSTLLGQNAIVAGWFDGGFCTTQNPNSGVYYETVGEDGERKLIIQMQDQVYWSARQGTYYCSSGNSWATNTITWQIVLNEGSNTIELLYKDATGGSPYDNEYLTAGIQGSAGGEQYGIQYKYRSSPSTVIADETAVKFVPPPPKRNDLKLSATTIPEPISLAEDNILGATVTNNGVNCDEAGDCTPVPETNVDVTANIFSVKETVTEYDFNDRSDAQGWSHSGIGGASSKWTQALNDGAGNYNYGTEGTDDGSWSSGRKSTTFSGLFNGNQRIHYDGEDILVADRLSDSVKKIDTSNSNSVSTVLGPDATNLKNVLDITSDEDYYYTLARSSSTYSATTRICKWDRGTGELEGSCSTQGRYGTALAIYEDADELFLLQTSSSSTYRKIVGFSSSNLALNGKSISYGSGVSTSYYSQDLDVDENTGDVYVVYREFNGRMRAYDRADDGSYCPASSCYTQVFTGARYAISVDVHDGYVYTSGFYYSSYYGGVKKMSTSSLSSITTMWGSYTQGTYKGSIAVTDSEDIYVSSNYAFSYYNFLNFQQAVYYFASGSTSGTATTTIGPAPTYLAALSSPAMDLSDAVGLKMSFKISYNFYFRYEGAYLEVSTDGGNNWNYVGNDKLTGKKYYGTTYTTWGNPLDTSKDAWTYYDSDGRYSSYSNTESWKETTASLDEYTGYEDVRVRFVVGYNERSLTYYNSFFRVDDVTTTVLEADQNYATETVTIDSISYKESESVNFFATNKFKPSTAGLNVGDTVGISINVPGNENDEDKSNQRVVVFREVKYVIFADDFEGEDKGWTTGAVQYGTSDWAVRSITASSGANSMDSGYRNSNQVPSDTYVATPALDLSLPVEAEIQMKIAYYGYYTYDGYQAQISDDGGNTWSMITPVGGYPSSIYNYAYYGNPLRGQPAYTYYGSSTTFTYSPDSNSYIDVKFNLNEYTGSDNVMFRWVAGWSSLSKGPAYFNSFLRIDDFAVTGLVYTDNVGVTGIDLPDPIGVDETVSLSTSVVNAGINNQTAGAAKLRLQLGPMGIATYDSSDDLEDYTATSDAESAGWTMTDKECNTTYGTCSSWGSPAGFTIVADDDVTAFGPEDGEFEMYYSGGLTATTTPTLNFADAESDLKLTLKHRYNFDYFSGMSTAYNGGQVLISTDNGDNWELFIPEGGYPGTMYNYAFYANPLYNQAGFVHCGDCTGVSGTASDNEDKYIETVFDMADYVGETEVKLKFQVGMYRYQYPGDGEHWYVDSLSFTGTGMESVLFEDIVAISGAAGPFVSGEKFDYSKDYHFQVPGEYKIEFTTWIGSDPSAGDDFAGDNTVAISRETMFTIAGTTADADATSSKNDELNRMYYEDGWTSAKDGGPEDGHQWRTDATSGSPDSPVWWIGPDAYGTSYNGDDVSLMSPVLDLSQATSAKLVFDHVFSFYASVGSWSYYYDGGRVEISTDGGDNWDALPITSGEGYGGTIYNYAYYGNPLRGQQGFVASSSGGNSMVESQCSLNDYIGEGFDNVRIRFRYGGAFPSWGSTWSIDNVGIYGLGFDLKQTSSSVPYTLEVGESTTITTSFINQGKGDLGAGGAMSEAYAYAYVNDMSGNELWSSSSALGNLDMAYYAPNELGEMVTFAGESTPTITFDFPGMSSAGMYTAGVMVADSDGNMLSDLFTANNDANHMLLVGLGANMETPMLAGGSNWAAATNVPAEVGNDALAVAWDETGVATGTLAIDIAGQGTGFVPESPTIQIGTTVTWTNSDSMVHTVTDKASQFDSFDISPGASYQITFNEVGVFTYYCKYHPMMEGTITVTSDNSADEQARTNYINVWSPESYLVFWAKYDLSDDSTISVYAQKKGSDIDDVGTLPLWNANGFKIMDGSDHSEVGDSLTGDSGWNPYYIYLDSNKLGYNSLAYSPEEGNSYAFVFRARGVEGTAEIGNVQVIRTQDTAFFFAKHDPNKLTYEIFPSLAVEMDYFAKNIGTEDNEFQFTPHLVAQGKEYMGAAFTITVQVMINGVEANDMTSTSDGNGTYTYGVEMAPDDEAKITVRFLAPDFDAKKGEPAGNRKFDVKMDPVDTGSDEEMREPTSATLFIKPSQFVLGEMSYDRQGVLEGDSLAITVKAWNEGNYASDVLMVVYVIDSTGDAYNTPDGVKRMTRVASTTEPVMAPKPVLESQGIYQTWYPITAVWEEAFIPGETTQDFTNVELYAMINPEPEQIDIDNGHKKQDEYLNQKDDNDAFGQIAVVKDKSSTPSFALGIVGMSVAALVAAAGASLRREEE
ncbi:MAG: plastocyanin/azurin family copper-binding protein [Candidatus Thermoplasmatota archaeon]|nr:plastocyanin/azurin family copper-binding protein [Candidatus Thermoplasmatota archaeon]